MRVICGLPWSQFTSVSGVHCQDGLGCLWESRFWDLSKGCCALELIHFGQLGGVATLTVEWFTQYSSFMTRAELRLMAMASTCFCRTSGTTWLGRCLLSFWRIEWSTSLATWTITSETLCNLVASNWFCCAFSMQKMPPFLAWIMLSPPCPSCPGLRSTWSRRPSFAENLETQALRISVTKDHCTWPTCSGKQASQQTA